MAIASTDPVKSADTSNGSTALSGESQLESLLTRSDLGARVVGLVLKVEEPRTFEGKNNDGSAYKSHSRRMEVFAGASGSVICGERSPDGIFPPVRLGAMVNWPILGAKTEGKQMVFRVSTVG